MSYQRKVGGVFRFHFFTFYSFNEKLKYKRTWFLYVISNKGFPEFSTAKTIKQLKQLFNLKSTST